MQGQARHSPLSFDCHIVWSIRAAKLEWDRSSVCLPVSWHETWRQRFASDDHRHARVDAAHDKLMEQGMDWTVTDIGNETVLVDLSGRLDVPGALKADPAFAEIAENNMYVIVDLSKLAFLASLGIRTLVSTSKTLRAKNGNLVLLAPQDNIAQVLSSSGIDTIIPVVNDRAAAEASVRE
jgi:anti-anti-sigma factor